jgi:hypothetical protein
MFHWLSRPSVPATAAPRIMAFSTAHGRLGGVVTDKGLVGHHSTQAAWPRDISGRRRFILMCAAHVFPADRAVPGPPHGSRPALPHKQSTALVAPLRVFLVNGIITVGVSLRIGDQIRVMAGGCGCRLTGISAQRRPDDPSLDRSRLCMTQKRYRGRGRGQFDRPCTAGG